MKNLKPRNSTIYTCPMHPDISQENPGMCPECGMNLVPQKQKTSKNSKHGHGKHSGHSTNIFKVKFWASLVLSVPIVAYSNIAQKLLSYEAPAFSGNVFWSPDFQAQLGEKLNQWSQTTLDLLTKIPEVAWGVILLVSFVFFISKAVKKSKQQNDNNKFNKRRTGKKECNH